MFAITAEPECAPEALDVMLTAERLGADDVDQFRELVQDCTRAAEDIAGVPFVYRTYKELVVLPFRRDGGTHRKLYLRARPPTLVSSIAFGTDDALVEGTTEPIDTDEFSIWPEEGYLWREDGFEPGLPGWLVSYSAGYWLPSMDELPSSAYDIDLQGRHIRRAVQQIVEASFAQIEKGGDPSLRVMAIGGDAPVRHEWDTQNVLDVFVPDAAKATLEGLSPLL